MKRHPAVTLNNIDRGMAIVARKIRTMRGGRKFLPIFIRLKQERDALLSIEAELDAALSRVQADPGPEDSWEAPNSAGR